jgi:hypothetical protein
MREQVYFWPLMKRAILAAEARVFGLAYLVERVAQMAHDVELVEQDRRLRCVRRGRVAKRLPHVHHRQTHSPAFFSPSQA